MMMRTAMLGRSCGFTLLEMMVVLGLFSLLFSAMIGLLINSDTFFTKGQNEVAKHYEARKLLDTLTRGIRMASPNWLVNGTNYPLAVSENFTRIDFYSPEFDASNGISGLKKMTYKLDPADSSRLLMKEGSNPETVISDALSYLRFGAGCGGCASYNCTAAATDCPVVRIEVRTKNTNQTIEFPLETKVALRNRNSTLDNETEIEAPQQGEF